MRKILSKLTKIIKEENLIENGDKIAVGVSGGKDSLMLLKALKEYQNFSEINFEIIALSVDLSNGEMKYDKITDFCKNIGVEFHLQKSNVFEIIFEIRKEKNPCSLCANMRRGQLNSFAKELGCNKVALGHHMDDLIETFALSLFFEGRLSTFMPSTYLSRVDLTVIRPLLYVSEDEISHFAKDFPIIKNTCPKDKNSQRENAKNLLKNLDENYGDVRKKIFTAITHPERINLWKLKK